MKDTSWKGYVVKRGNGYLADINRIGTFEEADTFSDYHEASEWAAACRGVVWSWLRAARVAAEVGDGERRAVA